MNSKIAIIHFPKFVCPSSSFATYPLSPNGAKFGFVTMLADTSLYLFRHNFPAAKYLDIDPHPGIETLFFS